MTPPEIQERFSRQVILPQVGVEGQKKWSESTVLLAGEGPALEAAQTAVESSGACPTVRWNPESRESLPDFSLALVLTEKAERRRNLNRLLRAGKRKAVFAWPSGNGFSLFAQDASLAACPCLECFEVMNPKAFSAGAPSVQRLLGALAASEALQWILKGESPLRGKVWLNSLADGISFHHEVRATPKCPARLRDEGAGVTP